MNFAKFIIHLGREWELEENEKEVVNGPEFGKKIRNDTMVAYLDHTSHLVGKPKSEDLHFYPYMVMGGIYQISSNLFDFIRPAHNSYA